MEKEGLKNSITDNKDIENHNVVDSAAKRVLIVGKLKGLKETAKTKKAKSTKTTTKKTTKAKTTKSTTAKSPAKKTSTAKKVEKEAISKVSSDDTKKLSIENDNKEEKTKANNTIVKEESKKDATTNATVKEDAKKENADNTTKKEETKKGTTTKKTTKKETTLKEEDEKNISSKEESKKENTKKVSTKKEKTKTSKTEQAKKEEPEKKAASKKKTEAKKDIEPKKIEIVETIEKLEKKSKKPSTTKAKTKKATAGANVLRVNPTTEKVQANNIISKNVIIAVLVVALLSSLLYIGYIGKQNVSNRILYSSLSRNISVEELTNKGLQATDIVKELQQENPEIKGWIKIDGTNIDYPLLQGLDNEYYLKHNYKNENTSYGSIFVNTNSDLKNDNSNIIIYGHDMRDGQMFTDLIKYSDKAYYDAHPTIKITTDESENEYTIVSAFKSKVFYKDEKNVFRFYNYYNLEDENQYNEYVSNCKKLQLYDTGVEANYGDQLVTLITCEYSNENGRMVVLAKKN